MHLVEVLDVAHAASVTGVVRGTVLKGGGGAVRGPTDEMKLN